eukprot:COSAG01_NODE_7606_length_3129_cov_63.881848_2_plen_449_part_00
MEMGGDNDGIRAVQVQVKQRPIRATRPCLIVCAILMLVLVGAAFVIPTNGDDASAPCTDSECCPRGSEPTSTGFCTTMAGGCVGATPDTTPDFARDMYSRDSAGTPLSICPYYTQSYDTEAAAHQGCRDQCTAAKTSIGTACIGYELHGPDELQGHTVQQFLCFLCGPGMHDVVSGCESWPHYRSGLDCSLDCSCPTILGCNEYSAGTVAASTIIAGRKAVGSNTFCVPVAGPSRELPLEPKLMWFCTLVIATVVCWCLCAGCCCFADLTQCVCDGDASYGLYAAYCCAVVLSIAAITCATASYYSAKDIRHGFQGWEEYGCAIVYYTGYNQVVDYQDLFNWFMGFYWCFLSGAGLVISLYMFAAACFLCCAEEDEQWTPSIIFCCQFEQCDSNRGKATVLIAPHCIAGLCALYFNIESILYPLIGFLIALVVAFVSYFAYNEWKSRS